MSGPYDEEMESPDPRFVVSGWTDFVGFTVTMKGDEDLPDGEAESEMLESYAEAVQFVREMAERLDPTDTRTQAKENTEGV